MHIYVLLSYLQLLLVSILTEEYVFELGLDDVDLPTASFLRLIFRYRVDQQRAIIIVPHILSILYLLSVVRVVVVVVVVVLLLYKTKSTLLLLESTQS